MKAIHPDAYSISDLVWDDDSKLYRYPNHRIVSKYQLGKLIGREQSKTNDRIQSLTDGLIKGSTRFEDWQRGMASELRDGHVKMTRFGRGGKDKTYTIHYFEAGNELRRNQYPALRRFAADIQSGNLSEKQIRARVKQYADSMKISYEKSLLTVEQDKGQYWARRRLGSCVNHCQDCIDMALQGGCPSINLSRLGSDVSVGAIVNVQWKLEDTLH